jgi:tryptophan synthase beta chain
MELKGRYGDFGGFYVPEVLMPALEEIEQAFLKYTKDEKFLKELDDLYKYYAGRPTTLYHAKRFSAYVGFDVYLKREDLLHGGAHKINNTLGQGLLAKYMGKKKLIAETGAGQHGLATAMIGALLGMETKIFMGSTDVVRQSVNVHKMRLLGSEVVPVSDGTGTLKDAINEALRYWTATVDDTFYLFGTAAGPHPFPMIVRYFQSPIGVEAREQCIKQIGRLPDIVTACVGGGSNAIGIFSGFINDKNVRLVGVEGGGKGINTKEHCATLCVGKVGVLHGSKSYLLQDSDGQISETECISAGLDYPGVGPEHSHLKDIGRAEYVNVNDEQVLDVFGILTKLEGILPALESSHSLAWVLTQKGKLPASTAVVVNLSGRGDKDIGIVEEHRPLKMV